ncbi:MAG: bacteriohemerythrin [Clostridia bacterium]|nr:bacteriohemerythrin [Clostridia bacterium]
MGIEWKESYAVGVKAIDEQHKELFAKVNQLFEACNHGKGREEINNTIKFLEEYVVVHFNAEQELMNKNSYPAFEEHKSQHQQFIKNFSELKSKIELEGATIHTVMLLNRSVVDWLVKHIGNSDKALGKFLGDKG